MANAEKLFRLLRQSEMHAEAIRLQMQVSRLKSQLMQANLDEFTSSLAEVERMASCHRGMMEQASAAAMTMLEEERK